MIQHNVPRTAVIKPCCIGDCVMALPAIDSLAKASAGGTVDVFTGQHSAGVFGDRLTVADIHRCPETFAAANALRFGTGVLRKSRVDRLLVLDRSRWLRIAAMSSGVRDRHSIVGKDVETRHESDVYLDLVRQMGLDVGDPLPYIQPGPASQASADRLVPLDSSYAVVHPGGGQNPGSVMLEKRWPPERFAEVVHWLGSMSIPVLLTGSSSDLELCEQVARSAGTEHITVLAGRADLMTTAAILRRSRIFIGADTGISHIAAAVGAPVVVIFGPTNPGRYRPLGKRVTVLCPPASWEIADVDLRRPKSRSNQILVESVTANDVIIASGAILSATQHHESPTA